MTLLAFKRRMEQGMGVVSTLRAQTVMSVVVTETRGGCNNILEMIRPCCWKNFQLEEDHCHLTARQRNAYVNPRISQQLVKPRDKCRADHLTVPELVTKSG